MSSTRQAELTPQVGVGLELLLLCDALDVLDRGAFLFAVCEEGALRERLMRHVADHLDVASRTYIVVEFSPDQPDLAAELTQEPVPAVVFVRTLLAEPGDESGVRTPEKLHRALRELNFQRERLARLNVPLVFWISQNGLGQLAQHAADVFAARSGLFFFETPLREPGAPLAARAEATLDLLRRFSRTQIPADELRPRAALYERRLERQQSVEAPNWAGLAFLCRDLASIYGELDNYEKAGQFQDQAIEAYQRAIAERETADTDGARQEWADLLIWLGNAYGDRLRGERAENLEQAIGCYERALEVRTREAFPVDWAMTQNNLGIAYRDRIRGERAENLERAIGCYERALEVYTREAFPVDWAMTQNNLGNAYGDRIRGERAENLERALGCYERVLEVYTREAFPVDWAMTQNNLGLAYADRLRGERAENVEQALGCFQAALSVWTAESFPRYHEIAVRNLQRALDAARPPSFWKRLRAFLARLVRPLSRR